MTHLSRARRTALIVGSLIALGACAPTTIDTSITIEPPQTTTTTIPVGTPQELLTSMVDTAATLSDLIGDKGHKREAMERIDAIWKVAQPQFDPVADEEFVTTVNAQVELCRIAVDRSRPADADKCFRNLRSLRDSHFS